LSGELLRPEDYGTFPYFQYEDEPLESVLSRVKLPVAVIATLALIAMVSGLIRFRRYPIL
jgi:hypothetical protein